MVASKCVDFYPTGLIEPGARQPLHILRPMPSSDPYPSTPDGRYFVVKGRLWRMSNPGLDPEQRQALVNQLMQARRQVGIAKKAADPRPSAAPAMRSTPPSAASVNAVRSGGSMAHRTSTASWSPTRRMQSGMLPSRANKHRA
jgi:hypothetical protein